MKCGRKDVLFISTHVKVIEPPALLERDHLMPFGHPKNIIFSDGFVSWRFSCVTLREKH